MKTWTIILAAIVFLTVSCKRNFDEPNPDMMTSASYWQSEEDAIKGINAVYSGLNRSDNYYNRWMHFEIGRASCRERVYISVVAPTITAAARTARAAAS